MPVKILTPNTFAPSVSLTRAHLVSLLKIWDVFENPKPDIDFVKIAERGDWSDAEQVKAEWETMLTHKKEIIEGKDVEEILSRLDVLSHLASLDVRGDDSVAIKEEEKDEVKAESTKVESTKVESQSSDTTDDTNTDADAGEAVKAEVTPGVNGCDESEGGKTNAD